MTNQDLFRAMGDLDTRFFLEAAPKEGEKRKNHNHLFTKIASVACVALTLVTLLFFALHYGLGTPDAPNDGVQSPDIAYGAFFNDHFYELYFSDEIYQARYPELRALAERTAVGYTYHIKESDLGAYMGVFPAIVELGFTEGEAYHWAAYPEYDAIIIVAQNDTYRFYVTDGNRLSANVPKDSSSVLRKLGLPNSACSFTVDDLDATPRTDKEALTILCTAMNGKQKADAVQISKQKWEAWIAAGGDTGVGFDGTSATFENHTLREEYSAFYGATIHSIWLRTENGFDLWLTYDTEFRYISLCGYHYMLSEAEVDQINAALGIASQS